MIISFLLVLGLAWLIWYSRPMTDAWMLTHPYTPPWKQ